MKRFWICLAVLALLLTACGAPAGEEEIAPDKMEQETTVPEQDTAGTEQDTPEPPEGPQPGQFRFTRENFPRLDGSTSTVPLARAMAAVLLSESEESVSDLVQFSKTTESYRQLMYGNRDLLLAAEPAESVLEEKEELDFAWVMEPFAIDGLIFVVSADNPVDSLTPEEVRQIYTGEITNWSQVGGDDVEIVPFQRNAEAGSQTMMLKLVMDGQPMVEAPMEQVVDSMYGLMEAVRSFDGSTGAIGYSVYYYANDMRMAEGLKILKINGVEPDAATFRDGTYPFTNPYYVLMAEDQPEDSPTRILFDWILGEDGQRLVNQMGYAGVLDPEATS